MAGEVGRYHTLSRADFGFIAPGQMRGCTFNPTSQHYWIYALGAWCGKDTAQDPDNVTVRYAVYAVDGSLNPVSRFGYTASATANTVMVDAFGGAPVEATVEVIDIAAPSGVTFTAIPVASGTSLHFAFLGTVGSLGHGMAEAADIVANNEKFYNRSGLSQPPPNPFGSYTSSTEGHLAIWGNAEANTAPNAPSSLSPAGTINETVPQMTATHTDGNSDRGDYINQSRIQVRRQSDGVSFWDSTETAGQTQRTASQVIRTYGGTTLVRGTTYEWRVQTSDHFNTWSAWTAWTAFTPANLGFVTLDSDPTGKIESNQPDFKGRWNHQSAANMTRVQVRILNGSGTTVLQTGADYDIADVASSAAPGTLFTIPWANTGLSTLAWGTSYQYQIRGKDATLWSDWSAARTFNTNAAPTVPSNLSPSNSAVSSSFPLLTCSATDADDTTASGLTVKARIKNNAGSVLFTRTMTLVGSTWQYQTNGTDLASFATYKWDAYSGDGTLWSGEQTVEANAVKSSEATFVYAQGPVITITSPAEAAVVTTSNLPVTWTVTDQQQYRVRLYVDGESTPVYDSGVVVTTVAGHTIPSGYLLNDTAYDLTVEVTNSAPLTGTSAIRNFTVDYEEPDPVTNFTATAVAVGTDIWPSAIRLAWDQTTYGTSNWQEYTLTRQAENGPDAGLITWQRVTSPSQVTITDYVPASGVAYTYTITQTTLTGLDLLTSAPVSATATVTLGGVVLTSVTNPETVRTALRYTNEREHPRDIDEAVYQPVNGALPTTVRSRKRVPAPAFDVKLFADAAATASGRRLELEALDIEAGTICYRDNQGRKQFCTMPRLTITDQVPDWFDAKIALRAEQFTEGVD